MQDSRRNLDDMGARGARDVHEGQDVAHLISIVANLVIKPPLTDFDGLSDAREALVAEQETRQIKSSCGLHEFFLCGRVVGDFVSVGDDVVGVAVGVVGERVGEAVGVVGDDVGALVAQDMVRRKLKVKLSPISPVSSPLSS